MTRVQRPVQRDLGDGHRLGHLPASRATIPARQRSATAVGSAPTGRFAIVAHSAGGVIGAEVARLAPERVSAFLAVAAVVPEPGGSFISAMPAPNRWVLDAAMRLAGTRPPNSAIRRRLAHRLDDQTADRIIADFAPESPGLYRDRTAHRSWSGVRGYVLTTQDREVPIALQQRCARRLGHAWGDRLDTGHLPMLEDPKALVGSIARFLDSRP
ncbi:alpha/beta fold hydrolase [Micromonospora sp. NPDC093277]|uniref:alpha/beta fold hydrolase n=1 Tax=Micromonospora sp. NPDC093277 TaxID=3364291 RepID=UPI00380C4310